jgi:uncharacterized protein with PQ loop repeat
VLAAEIFGFIAALLGVMQGLPQARRVRTLGHSQGVSLAMWMLMTSSSAAWLGYGIRTGSPSLIVSTVATGVINARVVLAITEDARRVVPRIAGVFVVVVAVGAAGPLWLVNPALFAFTLSRVPQIIRSWRSRRSGLETSAVSVGSIALSMGCLFSWEVYSVLLRSPTLIGTTTLALLTNIIVAWLELSSRRASRGASTARA